jgi:hypothetical protein
VANISVAMSPLVFVVSVLKDKDVSGPDSMKDDDTFRVSVYGGPYDFVFRVTLVRPLELRFHDSSVELCEGFCAVGGRRSRFWPGALGA